MLGASTCKKTCTFGGMRLDGQMASILRLQKQSAFRTVVVDLETMLLQSLVDCCKLSCRPASSESMCTEMARREDGQRAASS